MRVLVACERSGVVRRAMRERGHEAHSCDVVEADDGSPHHIRGDAVEAAYGHPWDLMIAHAPCTYLANSGAKWLYRGGQRRNGEDPQRWADMREGAAFFLKLANAPIKRKALENPIPHKYAANIIGRPMQIIQPWQFGHREMKATGLWLWNLPKLLPTDIVGPPPEDARERRKWAVVHRMAPGPDRQRMRGVTYAGIASAMAAQWAGPFSLLETVP